MRYSLNLYFGFEREWCWFRGTLEEAEAAVKDWADSYVVRPDLFTVYACPESGA